MGKERKFSKKNSHNFSLKVVGKESNYESPSSAFSSKNLNPFSQVLLLQKVKGHLVEGEHDAEEVDQDPEGVEDVMPVGTLDEQNQAS